MNRIERNTKHAIILKTIAATLLIAVLAVPLLACGRLSATNEDFVGIWMCYKSKTDIQEEFHEKDEGVNQFLIILEDGTAWEVVTFDGADPMSLEYRWYITQENRRTGEDSGIVLFDDQFYNPFIYYEADANSMEPHFVDERLVRGNLAIDYGYREDYFEKVSHDPYDPAWVPGGRGQSLSTVGALDIPEGSIDWTEASKHIGETVTVCGPVKDSSFLNESNGQPTYIDIGAAYPDSSRVSMVVWGEDRGNFSGNPESMYLGKMVCVTGELYAYDNSIYVKVASPDQVTVLD